MSMDEQEQIQVINQLQGILRELGLGWIVEQVNEQIQSGKMVKKEVQMFKEIRLDNQSEFYSTIKPSGKKELTATEDYTVTDQLQLLIDAIELTAESASAMRREITTFFDQEGRRTGVEESDVILPDVPDQFIRINETMVGLNDEQTIIQLRSLLNQIRQEIN